MSNLDSSDGQEAPQCPLPSGGLLVKYDSGPTLDVEFGQEQAGFAEGWEGSPADLGLEPQWANQVNGLNQTISNAENWQDVMGTGGISGPSGEDKAETFFQAPNWDLGTATSALPPCKATVVTSEAIKTDHFVKLEKDDNPYAQQSKLLTSLDLPGLSNGATTLSNLATLLQGGPGLASKQTLRTVMNDRPPGPMSASKEQIILPESQPLMLGGWTNYPGYALVTKELPAPTRSAASLQESLSDPITGLLMFDAVVFPCGHSFGGNSIKQVQESGACKVCGASIGDRLVPNLGLRAAVAAYHREAMPGDAAEAVKHESPSQKRRREAEGLMQDQEQSGPKRIKEGPPLTLRNRPAKPAQAGPFQAGDRVLIKGNKRTPERFFGREAIIKSAGLNGWYLVRLFDSGETLRVQYRSLSKVAEEAPSPASTSSSPAEAFRKSLIRSTQEGSAAVGCSSLPLAPMGPFMLPPGVTAGTFFANEGVTQGRQVMPMAFAEGPRLHAQNQLNFSEDLESSFSDDSPLKLPEANREPYPGTSSLLKRSTKVDIGPLSELGGQDLDSPLPATREQMANLRGGCESEQEIVKVDLVTDSEPPKPVNLSRGSRGRKRGRGRLKVPVGQEMRVGKEKTRLLRKEMLAFEARVPWTAVQSLWRAKRSSWKRSVKDCSGRGGLSGAVAELAGRMNELQQYLVLPKLRRALGLDWSSRVARCQMEGSPELLVELWQLFSQEALAVLEGRPSQRLELSKHSRKGPRKGLVAKAIGNSFTRKQQAAVSRQLPPGDGTAAGVRLDTTGGTLPPPGAVKVTAGKPDVTGGTVLLPGEKKVTGGKPDATGGSSLPAGKGEGTSGRLELEGTAGKPDTTGGTHLPAGKVARTGGRSTRVCRLDATGGRLVPAGESEGTGGTSEGSGTGLHKETTDSSSEEEGGYSGSSEGESLKHRPPGGGRRRGKLKVPTRPQGHLKLQPATPSPTLEPSDRDLGFSLPTLGPSDHTLGSSLLALGPGHHSLGPVYPTLGPSPLSRGPSHPTLGPSTVKSMSGNPTLGSDLRPSPPTLGSRHLGLESSEPSRGGSRPAGPRVKASRCEELSAVEAVIATALAAADLAAESGEDIQAMLSTPLALVHQLAPLELQRLHVELARQKRLVERQLSSLARHKQCS